MPRKLRIIFFICICAFNTITALKAQIETVAQSINESEYIKGTIIVRLKNHTAGYENEKLGNQLPDINQIIKDIPLISSEEMFPSHTHANERMGKNTLSGIYKLTLDENIDIFQIINQLIQKKEVLYAEPYYKIKPLLYEPNDPEADQAEGSQSYLSTINAYNAWGIEKGDTNIVIGVLDTGIDVAHSDLLTNLYLNHADPINGVDDDLDGYVDNYLGWDMADDDNSPVADFDEHGTSVASLTSATPDNNLGMAGTGFNSKYMPVKIFKSSNNSFNFGYEAIEYAADKGCKVINLSWGGVGSYSQFAQDIINYVVLEKDVVVVAAAGNTNDLLTFYPASYDNVLSVGALQTNDNKPDWSTYSYYIDITAPGHSNYAALNANKYGVVLGSSFAAPLVAGTAALIRSRYPNLTAQQVMERLRVTSDDIYDVGNNLSFNELLGKGRLNMYNALVAHSDLSVRASEISYDNGIGEFAFHGDTVEITAGFTNYLDSIRSVTVTLTTTSPYAQVIDSVFTVGSLGTLKSTSNEDDPFLVYLSQDTPPSTSIIIRLGYEGINYSDYEYFEIRTTSDQLILTAGDLSMDFNSVGNLGLSTGISYKNETILSSAGLIITNSENNVSDNAIITFGSNTHNADFISEESLKLYGNSEADLDARSVFIENPELQNNIGIKVEQRILAWDDISDNDFMVVEYRVINTTDNPVNDVEVALFADWDIGDYTKNKANYDAVNMLGYACNNTQDQFAGLALISAHTPSYYAIDRGGFNGNVQELDDLFTDSEKYFYCSNGVAKQNAGTLGDGNDIAHMMGASIPSIGAQSAEKITFVVIAASSLASLQSKLAQAIEKYDDYYEAPPVLGGFAFCSGGTVTINPHQGEVYEFYDDIDLNDLLEIGTEYTTPILNDSRYYYVISKDESYDGDIQRVKAYVKNPNPDFTISPDTLFLDESGNTSVQFTDQSLDGVQWDWDLGNDFISNLQNPVSQYEEVGEYDISMVVQNDVGCEDAVQKKLVVVQRSLMPIIDDQTICKYDAIELTASNTDQIKVYAKQNLSQLLYTGDRFVSGPIVSDTIFYVTNIGGTYESLGNEVSIRLHPLTAEFQYHIDTLNLASNAIKFVNSSTGFSESSWYQNGQLFSTEEHPSLIFTSNTDMEIMLVVSNSFACKDTLVQHIEFKESSSPSISDITICAGSSAVIQPQGGHYFNFYADENKSTIVSRGSLLSTEPLYSDTIFYITSVDNLIESELVSVNIFVNNAAFSFSPSDIIESGEHIKFTPNSSEADSWTWDFGNGIVKNEQSPTIAYQDDGEYDVTLIASFSGGCYDTLTQTMGISSITNTPPHYSFQVFPNPTQDHININKLPSNWELIRVMDQLGREVKYISNEYIPKRSLKVDFRGLNQGIYYLEIQTNHEMYRIKVLYRKD